MYVCIYVLECIRVECIRVELGQRPRLGLECELGQRPRLGLECVGMFVLDYVSIRIYV
jgi:hypothetical protein